MKTALIIGGGFAGCAAAHQLALMGGWSVTLVEAAPYLGAGVRTQYYGGHPYTFGPRHFLTQWPHVFEYLNRYVPMWRCSDHQFLTYVESDEAFYGYPIHRDDIKRMPDRERIESELSAIHMSALESLDPKARSGLTFERIKTLNGAHDAKNFEEYWIKSIGATLYGKFVRDYSKKMWMIDDNREIDDFSWSPKGVTIKDGPREAWDSAISAYPIAFNGYDDYFRIATSEAKVLLGTSIQAYDIPRKSVVLGGETYRFDIVVNTISPDVLFEKCFGELPYVGRDLFKIVLPLEFVLPPSVYFCYYAGAEPFTRIVEYKKFTRYRSPTTLITLEIPSTRNKHYPLPIETEKARAERYFDLMPEGVFSIGRAGSYLYNVDIDDTIEHAFRVAKSL